MKETADFMVDFVGWDPVKKVYSICAPVIPVQECHKAMDVCNPAFEVEYFRDTLRIAGSSTCCPTGWGAAFSCASTPMPNAGSR